MFEDVVFAESHCRSQWQTRKVTDIHTGVIDPTRFASPQGSLSPLPPREAVVIYRPRARHGRRAQPASGRPLLLFERLSPGEDPLHSALM
jgi:hypothetical protein